MRKKKTKNTLSSSGLTEKKKSNGCEGFETI